MGRVPTVTYRVVIVTEFPRSRLIWDWNAATCALAASVLAVIVVDTAAGVFRTCSAYLRASVLDMSNFSATAASRSREVSSVPCICFWDAPLACIAPIWSSAARATPSRAAWFLRPFSVPMSRVLPLSFSAPDASSTACSNWRAASRASRIGELIWSSSSAHVAVPSAASRAALAEV